MISAKCLALKQLAARRKRLKALAETGGIQGSAIELSASLCWHAGKGLLSRGLAFADTRAKAC